MDGLLFILRVFVTSNQFRFSVKTRCEHLFICHNGLSCEVGSFVSHAEYNFHILLVSRKDETVNRVAFFINHGRRDFFARFA